MIYIENKHLYFKNIPKLSGHCPIFAGVIAKENIKKTDRCTTCALRKFLQRNHHEAEIFSKNISKLEHFSKKYR